MWSYVNKTPELVETMQYQCPGEEGLLAGQSASASGGWI